MDYNNYKYSKHIYILIQAPYDTDIYKIIMKKTKPVKQIMYSVNVTVCLLVNKFKREKQLTDIFQRESEKYNC